MGQADHAVGVRVARVTPAEAHLISEAYLAPEGVVITITVVLITITAVIITTVVMGQEAL